MTKRGYTPEMRTSCCPCAETAGITCSTSQRFTTPAVRWWPPLGSHEITESEFRQIFGYLRTIVPPVMRDVRRRIREHVGNEPIRSIMWRSGSWWGSAWERSTW
jgi:hypothetical protein